MHFTEASCPSVVAFLLIVGAVIAAFLVATAHSVPRKKAWQVAGSLFLWLGAISAVVAYGPFQKAPMPGLPVFLAIILLVTLGAALSPFGGLLARNVPVYALVLFQAFRLPLELVLHEWSAQRVIPKTMTWTGSNWDILTGIVALLAGPLCKDNKALAWLANGVGLVLLANVIRVAVLSSPLPFAWKVRPPLQLAFHLPYAWIVPVCVAGALFGHVILTRALLAKRR